MNTFDKTPAPVEVEVDSSRSPDSGRQFSVELGQKHHARRSRGTIKKLLFPATVGVALMAPGVRDMYQDQQREERHVALAQKAEKDHPLALYAAETEAARKLFGVKKAETGAFEPRTDEAHKLAEYVAEHTTNPNWQIPVDQLLAEGRIKISEDGKSFELDGQSYSFGRYVEKDSAYIIAGRTYQEDRLLKEDRLHMVSPVLVGGVHEEGLSREELIEKAYADTRKNLAESLDRYAEIKLRDDKIFASQR